MGVSTIKLFIVHYMYYIYMYMYVCVMPHATNKIGKRQIAKKLVPHSIHIIHWPGIDLQIGNLCLASVLYFYNIMHNSFFPP